MKQKLLNFARNFPLPKLLLSVISLGFLCDFLSALYFMRYWQAQDLSNRIWSLLMLSRGEDWFAVDEVLRLEMVALADSSMSFMLMVFLIVNTLLYIYLWLQKKWAHQYFVSFMGTASLLAVTILFEGFPVGGWWEAVNILTIPVYGALAFVLWARKAEITGTGLRLKRV